MIRTVRVALVLVGALALVGASACTPKVVGTTGVARTADGELVFLAEVCDDEVDGASITDLALLSRGSRLAANAGDDDDQREEAEAIMDSSRVVDWSEPAGSGSLTYRLDDDADLRPDVRYSFSASDRRQSWRLDGVRFTLADLEALVPGGGPHRAGRDAAGRRDLPLHRLRLGAQSFGAAGVDDVAGAGG